MIFHWSSGSLFLHPRDANNMQFKTHLCPLLFLLGCLNQAIAQDASAPAPVPSLNPAAAEIRKSVDAYVAAFNARDAAALSSMWTAEGVYTDSDTGERVLGRDQIAEQFSTILGDGDKTPTLAAETVSLEFVSPRVAIEEGIAMVTYDENDISTSEYTAVYVKENDKWLIDRITERGTEQPSSHYDELKALEWLIGDWVDTGDGFSIESSCKWTKNQTYIAKSYAITTDTGISASGLQIIGWDAKQKSIRSWLFDSDGGFVTGTWTPKDGKWVVQSVATLSDGASGSFTSIFEPLGDGRYAWQKVNRVVDGKLLPNIDQVEIQRK